MNNKEKLEAKQARYAKMKATILKKYGKDFYSKNGSKGGKVCGNRPFLTKEGAAREAALKSAEVRRKNSKVKK